MATGKEQKITITASSGLSDDEVDRMVNDAEKYAAEDEQRRKDIELRNQAEQLAYATEKTLEENKEKLPADEVAKVEEAIKALRAAIDTDDASRIKAEMENLTKSSHKLAELMYQAASGGASVPPEGDPTAGAPGGEAPGGDGAGDGDGDVIDAEFEETKD
jgi:molecular chaperone DnaK